MSYSPFFLHYMQSSNHLEGKNMEMMDRDWLTSALIKEIEIYYSKSEDLIVRNFDNSCCTDIDIYIFRDNCKNLFPIGRIFVSAKQL